MSEVADIVTFGSAEQDNNITNGKEPIEWIVLAKEKDKALVISRYVLQNQPFNTKREETKWEDCSIRKWLNESFLESVFVSDEQDLILSSKVKDVVDLKGIYDMTYDEETEDKIFLLNYDEAERFFSSEEERKCTQVDGKTNSGWWLRSVDSRSSNTGSTLDLIGRIMSGTSDAAKFVDEDGSIRTSMVDNDYNIGIRPVMWIKVN
jgi:hypothetical protein